jgi:hypothetical protein
MFLSFTKQYIHIAGLRPTINYIIGPSAEALAKADARRPGLNAFYISGVYSRARRAVNQFRISNLEFRAKTKSRKEKSLILLAITFFPEITQYYNVFSRVFKDIFVVL